MYSTTVLTNFRFRKGGFLYRDFRDCRCMQHSTSRGPHHRLGCRPLPAPSDWYPVSLRNI